MPYIFLNKLCLIVKKKDEAFKLNLADFVTHATLC